MNIYAVEYKYAADPEALDRHRGAHRSFLRSLSSEFMVAAGGFQETEEPGGLLLVRAHSEREVTNVLDGDPFLLHGLITSRNVRLWNPPIGKLS